MSKHNDFVVFFRTIKIILLGNIDWLKIRKYHSWKHPAMSERTKYEFKHGREDQNPENDFYKIRYYLMRVKSFLTFAICRQRESCDVLLSQE